MIEKQQFNINVFCINIILIIVMFTSPLFCRNAISETVDVNKIEFMVSRNWFQLMGDADTGIFRAYAIAIDANGNPLDVPNIFLLTCKSDNLYLTLHFPVYYKITGFDTNIPVPKTNFYIGNNISNHNYIAEYFKNEFYVDLNQSDFELLERLWTGKWIDLKIGRHGFFVHMSIEKTYDSDLFAKLLPQVLLSRQSNIKQFYFLDAFSHCLSKKIEVADGKHWNIWGIIFCANCPVSEGKAQLFLRAGRKDGNRNPFPTQQQCLQKRDGILATIQQKGLMASLLCIRAP